MTHHHEKWKQYQDLVALISEHEDRKSNMVGNNIPHDEETISKLREEMNMKQQKVNNNYRRLKVKVLRGISDDEFKDPRVRDLWKRAKAQGLSEEELELMKVSDKRCNPFKKLGVQSSQFLDLETCPLLNF